MEYGPVINGKQTPITPYLNSWACKETVRKGECPKCIHGKGFKCPSCWPITRR